MPLLKLKLMPKKGLSERAIENYVKLWLGHFQMNEKPLIAKLHSYFDAQEKEVQDNLKKATKANHFPIAMWLHTEQKDAVDDILFNPKNAINGAIDLITPMIAQYIKDSGGQAMQLVGTALTFDTTAPGIADFIKQRAGYFADSITDTTKQALHDTLSAGLDGGESFADLSNRVADVYNQARDYRTDRIARTEISASANFGSQQAYSQAGVEKIQWVVVNPIDDDCLDADSEVVKLGDTFSNGLTAPPVHPNCQCTTIPIFDDDSE